jgi:large subunit ribosomal protein L21
MRFAIVESGGKQYRAIEGRTLEVDRLPVEAGEPFNIARVLLVADGDDVRVGTPTVDGVEVRTTVVDHFKGPKIDRFKYRPKKRIRVRGGHRQQYTRLMVNFIGKPGEVREIEKPVSEEMPVETEAAVEAEEQKQKKVKTEKETKPKSSAKKTDKKTDKK